jgi:flagellar motility protein MotE (MotC chaperone)
MKSILIISSVTFLLIFGGIAIMSLNLNVPGPAAQRDPLDAAASVRLVRESAIERDRLQREHESLAGLRQSQAAQELVMSQVHDRLLEILGRLEEQQATFIFEQDAAAERLAKMYEAMKPDKAAEILSTLDLEVTLAIFGRMKERQAARILSFMNPGRAAQISTRLSLQGGD